MNDVCDEDCIVAFRDRVLEEISHSALRNPIIGIAGCCARTASRHAAAPPSSVMKSRRCAIGAMSRMKLKLRFGYSVPLTALVETGIRIAYPSAAEFTTYAVPMLPPKPGLFSITNCWPRRGLNQGANTSRA